MLKSKFYTRFEKCNLVRFYFIKELNFCWTYFRKKNSICIGFFLWGLKTCSMILKQKFSFLAKIVKMSARMWSRWEDAIWEHLPRRAEALIPCSAIQGGAPGDQVNIWGNHLAIQVNLNKVAGVSWQRARGHINSGQAISGSLEHGGAWGESSQVMS